MENDKLVVCPNCGERLLVDSEFCVKCGTKLNQEENVSNTTLPKNNPVNKKMIIIISGIVIAIMVIFFAINAVGAANLKKELLKDWEDIEGEDGSYIVRILDFSDDEIEYRLETGYAWVDTTVATYDYKVVNGNTIKVKRYGDEYETFTIEFNDDKTMMTVTPSLTSVDDEEDWFYFD